MWNGTCQSSCDLSELQPKISANNYYCDLIPPDFELVKGTESDIVYVVFNQAMNATLAQIMSQMKIEFQVLEAADFTYKLTMKGDRTIVIKIFPGFPFPPEDFKIAFSPKLKNMNLTDQLYESKIIKLDSIYPSDSQQSQSDAAKFSTVIAKSTLVVSTVIFLSNPLVSLFLLLFLQQYYYLLFLNVEYPILLETLLASLDTRFFFLPDIQIVPLDPDIITPSNFSKH
jgi:hypothetical protein